MMNRKFNGVALIFLLVCVIVSGCAIKMPQFDNKVKVTKVEPSLTLVSANASIPVVTQEMIIGVTSLAFRGTVLNNSDEYLFEQMQSDTISLQVYKGVVEFLVDEVIFSENNEVKNGDKIRILTNSCTNSFRDESVALDIGNEYIILASKIVYYEGETTFDFRQIADFCINDQRTTVMNISDGNVLFDPAYKTLTEDAKKVKRIKIDKDEIECFSMRYEDMKEKLYNQLYDKVKE